MRWREPRLLCFYEKTYGFFTFWSMMLDQIGKWLCFQQDRARQFWMADCITTPQDFQTSVPKRFKFN